MDRCRKDIGIVLCFVWLLPWVKNNKLSFSRYHHYCCCRVLWNFLNYSSSHAERWKSIKLYEDRNMGNASTVNLPLHLVRMNHICQVFCWDVKQIHHFSNEGTFLIFCWKQIQNFAVIFDLWQVFLVFVMFFNSTSHLVIFFLD